MPSELNTKLNQIKTDKDTYLTPSNIRKNVTVLGVTGQLEGIDTSDATATANDIVYDKTAYVNGTKLTGNIRQYSSPVSASSVLNTSSQRVEMYKTDYSYARYTPKNTQLKMYTSYESMRSTIGLYNPDQLAEGITVLGLTGTYSGDPNRVIYAFSSVEDMNAYLTTHQLIEGVKADVYNSGSASGGPFAINDEFEADEFGITKSLTVTQEDSYNLNYIDFYAQGYVNDNPQQYLYIQLRPASQAHAANNGILDLVINNGGQEYAYPFTADMSIANPTATMSDNDYNSFMAILSAIQAEATQYGVNLKFVVQRFIYSGTAPQSLIDTVNKFIYKAGATTDSVLTSGTTVEYDELGIEKTWTMTEQEYNALVANQPVINLIAPSGMNRYIRMYYNSYMGSPRITVEIYNVATTTYNYTLSMDSFVMNDNDYNYMLQDISSAMTDSGGQSLQFTVDSQYTYYPELLFPLMYKKSSGGSTTEVVGFYITKLNSTTQQLEWVPRPCMSSITNTDGLISNNNFFTLIEPRIYYSNGGYYDTAPPSYTAMGKFKPISLLYLENNEYHMVSLSFCWKDMVNQSYFPFNKAILLCDTWDPTSQSLPTNRIELTLSNVQGQVEANSWSGVLTYVAQASTNYDLLNDVKDIIFSTGY